MTELLTMAVKTLANVVLENRKAIGWLTGSVVVLTAAAAINLSANADNSKAVKELRKELNKTQAQLKRQDTILNDILITDEEK